MMLGQDYNTYEYFCYNCGKNFRDTASSTPTQCSCCSSTDIQTQFHKGNLIATTDPTINDDSTQGYCVNSPWINNSTGFVFKCVDASVGAAIWTKFLPEKEVNLAGTSPVDADVSAWAVGDRGQGIGTGGEEYYMIKRASGVKSVELN